ncbi:hypothetical protein [Microbacterium kunmingense]|uniref:hypothetical protein n=1 Tax=Microbacterium kunmingense TaxID=2915939 RepID=UPI002004AFB7|nr:hypothetical protein [Microbacterium kunmingense]
MSEPEPSFPAAPEAGGDRQPRDIRTGVDGIVLRLSPIDRVTFRSFVDCNMAAAWVEDRFRIFPGKYGEDPVWGAADDLKIGEGATVSEAFASEPEAFRTPVLPPNAPPGTPGLHGAIWFETVYQDPRDDTGKTLYALYHNENYPETLPFDPATGEGMSDRDWPPGLKGDDSIQAAPRIGIMRSVDGGESWDDRGILLEDRDERMIRLPVNHNYCFPGGVGDPSAVASGDHLYVFFGEYAYPAPFDASTWSAEVEASGQCVSVARVALADLDDPAGAARRWDGEAFAAPWDAAGQPIRALQIERRDGGGAVSQGDERYYWGPSVSWNEHLGVWVMLMGRVDGAFWVGDSIFVSINPHADLGQGRNAQDWSPPVEVLRRPGHTLWYPALQPTDSEEDRAARRTSLRIGREARLFVKDITDTDSDYVCDFAVEFFREK